MITDEFKKMKRMQTPKVVASKMSQDLPADFVNVLKSLKNANKSSSLRLIEVEPPKKLAKYSICIEATLQNADGEEIATGNFIVLYDTSKHKLWHGNLRIVTYIESELPQSKLYKENYATDLWKRFSNALDRVGAVSKGSTITTGADHYFGEIHSLKNHVSANVEIRASWTPESSNVLGDLRVFEKAVYFAAGKAYRATPTIGVR